MANAAIELGFNRIASIAEVTEYTLDIQGEFERVVTNGGGEIVFSENFTPGTVDFRTLIAKVKGVNPDAILILSQTGLSGAHFVKQSRETGLYGPFFSDFTFVSNQNAKDIVGSFDGIYFADPDYDRNASQVKEFFAKYEEKYGEPSVIPFHAAATYDSVKILAEAIESEGTDSSKVRDWILNNVHNRQGLMGEYSLDENGNSDLGFSIKFVSGDQIIDTDL